MDYLQEIFEYIAGLLQSQLVGIPLQNPLSYIYVILNLVLLLTTGGSVQIPF